MIAMLSLARWRVHGRQRFWSLVVAFALGIHVLAMAVHQPPAALAAAQPQEFCHEDGHGAGAPDGDSHGPQHPGRHLPPCSICQSLHALVPPPEAPPLAGVPWAPAPTLAPRAAEAPPPRLVLTDLNPRGPPVLG